MHTVFMKCYDENYMIKSENYFFLSSRVFYITLFPAVLNLQIFANPESGGNFCWPTKLTDVFSKYTFIHIFC